MSAHPFALGILAGGAGRRVGGRDKGWIELAGRPLIERVLEAYRHSAAQLLVNANRSQSRYAALGVEVVGDAEPDFPGPLAGVLALLQSCRCTTLITLPVDLAELPADLPAQLMQPDADLVRVADADGLQPLVARWSRDLLLDLQAQWAAGVRGVQAVQQNLVTNGVRLHEVDLRPLRLGNLNRIEVASP